MASTPYEHEDFEVESLDEALGAEKERGLHPGWIVAVLASAIFIALMLVNAFESEVYFYEADKAVAQGPELIGQTVRVKGIVEPGTVVGEDGKLGRIFNIAEGGKSIKVVYDRALPDTFEEGIEIVAQGRVDENYVLHADEVVVKCPSRYEGNAPTGTPQDPTVK